MTEDITVPKGDYGYNLSLTFLDADGDAFNITGYTVTLKVWAKQKPSVLLVDGACVPVIAASGTCTYPVAEGDFDVVGTYYWELEATKTGAVESSQSGLLKVEESG